MMTSATAVRNGGEVRPYVAKLLTSIRTPVLISAALLLTFAPFFLVGYIKDDDYEFSTLAHSNPAALYDKQAYNGRVLNGLLLYLSFPRVSRLESYRYIRLIGFVGMVWLALRLYVELRRQRLMRYTAAWLAYTLSVLPASAYYLSLTNSVFYLVAAALAAEAGCLAWRVVTQRLSRWAVFLGLVAVGLFVGAGLIYESAAMMYWVILAIPILAHQPFPRNLPSRFIKLLIIFGVGCLGIVLVHAWLVPPDNDHAALASDLGAKLIWFLGDPMRDALNMFVIPPRPEIALVAGVAIVLGVWLKLRGSLGQRLLFLGLLAVLVPLSFMPHIVAAHHWATYRTEIALTSTVVLYAAYAIYGYADALRGLLGRLSHYLPLMVVPVFALVAGFTAARNALVNVAIPNLVEFRYLRNSILNAQLTGIDMVYIIQPAWEDSCAAEVTQDFGALTTYWEWGVVPITQAALRAAGQDENKFMILAVGAGELGRQPDQSLLIDMRRVKLSC